MEGSNALPQRAGAAIMIAAEPAIWMISTLIDSFTPGVEIMRETSSQAAFGQFGQMSDSIVESTDKDTCPDSDE
jgi:hypothetical protein